jgi:K+-sensing histidine kinase KdpD
MLNMSVEGDRHNGLLFSNMLDDSNLTVVAASELASPLVLLRQLSLALGSNKLSDEERKLLSEKMTLTSERALRLTANLSMTSPAQAALPLEPVNPMGVCQDVIHELMPMFLAHGQRISLQQRSRVPLLVANRDLLHRILLGFGDNALYYGTAERPVMMSISGRGGNVRIGVRDYGPAVPIDIWKRLEGRVARRAPAPLANRPQTSGVGLIAARKLAEMMQSSVGLVRHSDGATFYVDLHVSQQMSLI